MVGPDTHLVDVVVGERTVIYNSVAREVEIGDDCQVGPFAYLRPGTRLAAGAKAGTFVELKNADIGEGTKVPHLSYVGDAEIGDGVEPRRQHDHRELRRSRQAPDAHRRRRAHEHPHVADRAGRARRRDRRPARDRS